MWALVVSLTFSVAGISQTVWLDEISLDAMRCGWSSPKAGRSVDGNVLTVAGETFSRGVGTHAVSTLLLNVNGRGKRFIARVGVDDETGNPAATIEFLVVADRAVVWRSGVMKNGDTAKPVDIDIVGVRKLGLLVTDGGDGIDYDHADWCDSRLEMNAPVDLAELTAVGAMPAARELILTPPESPTPRINGGMVFGVRPGHPVLYNIAASGVRPMKFSAANLPRGLSLDASKGRITGSLDTPGEHTVTLTVTNTAGVVSRDLRIVAGDDIALTPPLGWNSWNCWGGSVSAEKVLSSARAMVSTGLARHGWSYINIDDGWQGVRGGPDLAIQGNRKFPDMKGLADSVHALGLKIGIYSTPWMGSYEGHIGSSADNADGTYEWITAGEANADDRHNDYRNGRNKYWRFGTYSFAPNDARQWAKWGFDYLKYDWNPNDVPHVGEMERSLGESGRDIILSLSNSAPFGSAEELSAISQCWRTTGDIRDTWESMSRIGFSQERWRPFARPGHWNDPDMLVVGLVGWGPELRKTRLLPDEQYTHISLWSLLAAPLLLGCDLARLDSFTLGLLTNDEVLEVNQDPLGDQAGLLRRGDGREVWVKNLRDGSKAVGLFYPANEFNEPADYFNWEGETGAEMTILAGELGFGRGFSVRDLWRQKDLGVVDRAFTATVPYHGVVLLRVKEVSE